MKRVRRQRRGMTAVEVLAATVLSSLMLAAVAGVLGGLSRQQKVLRKLHAKPTWARQLHAQLLWDLRNSREQVATPNGIRLTGFGGRDFASGRPTGRPTAIEYLLVETETDRWLLRREEQLDARSNDSWRTEVVCRDVARIEWDSIVIDCIALVSIGDLAKGTTPSAVPERLSVKLFSTAGRTIFDEVWVMR